MVVIKHLIIMNKDAKIYVAGHTGLVGSAIIRGLKRHGYSNIITREYPGMDLINQQETINGAKDIVRANITRILINP